MPISPSNQPVANARFQTGVWIDIGCWIPNVLTTGAIGANIHYANKLMIPRGQVTSRVFCETTVAAAGGKLLRVGLYTVGTDGLPGALLYDSGSLAADAAAGDIGANVVMTIPYDEVYATVVSDGTPTLRAYTIERAPQFMGWRGAVTAVTKETMVSNTLTYGALPATFGAITTYSSIGYRVGIKT